MDNPYEGSHFLHCPYITLRRGICLCNRAPHPEDLKPAVKLERVKPPENRGR
jgi:hypothetical protein